MKGGGQFAIYDPIIVISSLVGLPLPYLFKIASVILFISVNIKFCFVSLVMQHELVYCLGVIKSAELNIIGRKYFACKCTHV